MPIYTLDAETARMVEKILARGNHASPDKVVEDGLRLLMSYDDKVLGLRETLRAADNRIDASGTVEVTAFDAADAADDEPAPGDPEPSDRVIRLAPDVPEQISDHFGTDIDEGRRHERWRTLRFAMTLIARDPDNGRPRPELGNQMMSAPFDDYIVLYRLYDAAATVLAVVSMELDVPDIGLAFDHLGASDES